MIKRDRSRFKQKNKTKGEPKEHTSLFPSIAPTACPGRKPGALHRRPDWQWHQTPVKYQWLTRTKLAISAPKEDRVVPNQRPHKGRSRPPPPHRTALTRVTWDPFQLTVTPHTHQKKKGSDQLMLPHCQMKATGGTSPTASFANGSKSDPSTPDRKSMTTNSPKAKHPCTPTTPAGRSWHDTGGQMPNTTWTRRAEAARGEPKPQHREITQQKRTNHTGRAEAPTQRNQTSEQGKTHGASQSPNPRKKHTQNRTKNTGRAEAPTQGNATTERDKTHGASRSPNTEKSHNRTRQNTRGEPKPQPRRGQQKTQNTNHTEAQKPPNQKGRRRKENKREKTRKPRKARKAQGQRRERRREDAQTGRPREEAKIKAWLHGPITAMVPINKEI